MSRAGTRRMVFASAAGLGFWALVVGLIVGEGWLRAPGLGVLVVFMALTFWADARMPPGPDPQVNGEVGAEFDAIDWHFPPHIDDRRTVTRKRAA